MTVLRAAATSAGVLPVAKAVPVVRAKAPEVIVAIGATGPAATAPAVRTTAASRRVNRADAFAAPR